MSFWLSENWRSSILSAPMTNEPSSCRTSNGTKQFTPSPQGQVEELLVKYNSIFARHLLDIGMNTDFKVKLTPQDDDPMYSQSLSTPTNLKDDLLVVLALMQEYGIITTLPYSKYSSPIFPCVNQTVN